LLSEAEQREEQSEQSERQLAVQQAKAKPKRQGCWLSAGLVGEETSAQQTQHRSKQLKQAHEQHN